MRALALRPQRRVCEKEPGREGGGRGGRGTGEFLVARMFGAESEPWLIVL